MATVDLSQNSPCPCGSGAVFGDCCQPLLAGNKLAATAQALMRSRYSAYVLENADYILTSWHASTRPKQLNLANSTNVWQGLTMLQSKEGEHKATVEFIARYVQNGVAGEVHENSRFVKEQGRWFYVDGDLKSQAKVGRNDPCPCGSGKKYKRCCG